MSDISSPQPIPEARFLSALERADDDQIRVMAKAGFDIDAPLTSPLYNGLTPLMLAAYWGNRGLCEVLIEVGADSHAEAHGQLEITALGNAAYMGREKVCRFLLDKNPSKGHILKAIELARSGWALQRNPHSDPLYREALNSLLWARDGISLPGSVTNLLAGEHPEVDAAEPATRPSPRPR